MRLIVCLSDGDGMLFNRRRLSRDYAVTEDIMKLQRTGKLYMKGYSAEMFREDGFFDIQVSEDPLREAGAEDDCFLEDQNPETFERVTELILYRWNRTYPRDLTFLGVPAGYGLTKAIDFAGKSHGKITREVYRKC